MVRNLGLTDCVGRPLAAGMLHYCQQPQGLPPGPLDQQDPAGADYSAQHLPYLLQACRDSSARRQVHCFPREQVSVLGGGGGNAVLRGCAGRGHW